MHLAISPCPNDTFLFYPWIAGFVGKQLPIIPHFYDIQELNQHALKRSYPLTKLSIAAYAKVRGDYDLLPIGAALGEGQGPKIVSKRAYTIDELSSLKVAIPGYDTTAHLLFKLFVPDAKEKHFCLYHEVVDLLHRGVVDAAVIIHETRFIFKELGLYEIADLGELFYQKTASPLPLGALALHKSHEDKKEQICSILLESLDFAKRFPEIGYPFILEKSQEKDCAIIKKHIELYVNEETRSLSERGKKAIELLLNI